MTTSSKHDVKADAIKSCDSLARIGMETESASTFVEGLIIEFESLVNSLWPEGPVLNWGAFVNKDRSM